MVVVTKGVRWFALGARLPQKRTETMAKEAHLEAAKLHTEAHAGSVAAHQHSKKAHEASVEHAH